MDKFKWTTVTVAEIDPTYVQSGFWGWLGLDQKWPHVAEIPLPATTLTAVGLEWDPQDFVYTQFVHMWCLILCTSLRGQRRGQICLQPFFLRQYFSFWFLIWALPMQYPFKRHEIKDTNSIGNRCFPIPHEFLSSWFHEFFPVFSA